MTNINVLDRSGDIQKHAPSTLFQALRNPVLQGITLTTLLAAQLCVVLSPGRAEAAGLCAFRVDEIPVNDPNPLKRLGVPINSGDQVSICIKSGRPEVPPRGGSYTQMDDRPSARTGGEERTPPPKTYKQAADQQLRKSGIKPESLPPETREQIAQAVAQENYNRPPEQAQPSSDVEEIKDGKGETRGVRIGSNEYYPIKKDDGRDVTYIKDAEGNLSEYDPKTGQIQPKGMTQVQADLYGKDTKFYSPKADLDGDTRPTETVYNPKNDAFANIETRNDGRESIALYGPKGSDPQKLRKELLNEGVSSQSAGVEANNRNLEAVPESNSVAHLRDNPKVVYQLDSQGKPKSASPMIRSYDQQGKQQGAVPVFPDNQPIVDQGVTQDGNYYATNAQGETAVIDREGNRTVVNQRGQPESYTRNKDLTDPNKKYGQSPQSLPPQEQQRLAEQAQVAQGKSSARTGGEEWTPKSAAYVDPKKEIVDCSASSQKGTLPGVFFQVAVPPGKYRNAGEACGMSQ